MIYRNGEAQEQAEQVNHPAHYQGSTECIDVMQDAFGRDRLMDFCLVSAFKYLYRCEKKQATPAEDIRKADWYLQKWLELSEEEEVGK